MGNSEKKGRSKRIQALLYSGLIFPGFGQFTLKRKKRAWFFIAASLILVSVLFVKIFIITNQVVSSHLVNDQVIIDLSADGIKKAVNVIKTRAYSEMWPFLLGFLGLWLAGILDILLIVDKSVEPD